VPIALRDTVAGCVLDQPGALPLGSPAAVLVPILDGDEPVVVFTRRADSLNHHRGEISFPGGRPEPGDADLRATALRETHEELGLPAEAVDVAGCLEPVQARVSGFTIVPFVGLLSERPEFVPSPDEIAEVIEIPLRDLLAIEEEREWEFEGGSYQTYAYVQDGHTVWGATARILKELLDGLRRGGWR
jgi:8-oxo-dGTP pyrophosphatase MutT (NUDIX family)